MVRNRTAERYATLAEYVAAKRGSLKKIEIAASLGVSPEKFSKLLRPELYRPFVSDELAAKLAARAAAALFRNKGDRCVPYRCAFCGSSWHIGHTRRSRRVGVFKTPQ